VLNDQIHEKFLMFIPSDDRSGFGLSNLIIKTVQDLGKNYFFQNEKIIELFPCFQDWTRAEHRTGRSCCPGVLSCPVLQDRTQF
jgi:hypothetical protein